MLLFLVKTRLRRRLLMQGVALFLAGTPKETAACYRDGTLDLSLTRKRTVVAQPIEKGEQPAVFASRGCVALSFDYLPKNNAEHDGHDDENLRFLVQRFLEGKARPYLEARFSSFQHIFPTHVTRRQVPPEGMPLVHIDYPKDFTLQDLTREWMHRWQSLEGWEDDMADKHELVGVVTVWTCLSPTISTNYPLWVAGADTVSEECKRVYAVKGKKHSVGVSVDSQQLQWYCQPNMKRGDVWLFDTQCNPHVSVVVNKESKRESLEVRVLLLREKKSVPT